MFILKSVKKRVTKLTRTLNILRRPFFGFKNVSEVGYASVIR
jgi:hypothetical protein